MLLVTALKILIFQRLFDADKVHLHNISLEVNILYKLRIFFHLAT